MDLDWISKFFETDPALSNEMSFTLPLNITLVGRVHHIRKCSNKMFFLILRDREKTVQVIFKVGIDSKNATKLTIEKIKEFSKTIPESIIKLTGQLTKSPIEIKTSTIKYLEIIGHNIEILSESEIIPLQVYKPDVLSKNRFNHRILDLRSQQNQIVFSFQSQIQQISSNFFVERDFYWLPFPKIIKANSESILKPKSTSQSTHKCFHLEYFGKEAFLAQSPQLHTQMAINAGFKRVFSIGPVFRAENCNKTNHLTEFTGINFEMEIGKNGRKNIINLIYELIRSIMIKLEKDNLGKFKIWETITNKSFNHPIIPEIPIVVLYKDACNILKEADILIESIEDFNDNDLLKLAELVKKKYQTDLFVLDEFPINSRPFYTQTKENDPQTSLGYDLILNGKEILSGSQKISDYQILIKKIKDDQETNLSELETSTPDYLDSFRYGSPIHAGAGFGLERIMWAYLDLPDIRNFSLFPINSSITS